MGVKDKLGLKLKLSGALGWRLTLGALVLLCGTMIGVLWVAGLYETRDAMESGRRILIRLDNGAIEGHPVTSEPAKPVAVAPPAAPAPAQPAPAPAPATQNEPQPALPAVPAAAAAANPAPAAVEPAKPAIADAGAVTPSTMPPAAVNPALLEKAEAGMAPVIGADGAKPWRYYAKPYARKGNLPVIAVIITGLGENKAVSDSAIKLPENFALSFSPYAKDVSSWSNSARVAGHEVLADLPLEPANYPAADPGPYGLLAGKGTRENETRLLWLMSRFSGYVGFVTPQSEVFTANDEAFKALLQLLANRGLMLVVGREPGKNEIKQTIDATATAHVTGDVLLDEELSASAIQTRLAALEKIAGNRGYAVGIAQAFPITIQQLEAWSAKLESDGFTLVPVTFIAKLKFS